MYQEFTQELKNLIETTQQNIHTVLPGKIVKFDTDKQRAQVSPTAKFLKPDGTKIDYPDIFEVPVFFIQGFGQKAIITHAVKPDDECLLFFFEQSLDQWRTKAESETDLRFDISNAVAVAGFFAEPNPHIKRACENESIIIQLNDTFVELSADKIEIHTDGDVCEEAAININIKAGANITVEAAGNVGVTANSVAVSANSVNVSGSSVNVSGSTINLN